jgi:predicted secreted protein
MAKEKGLNVLLKVGDGDEMSETFTTLDGQRNTTFAGSSTTANTTDKNNGGWETEEQLTRSGQVTSDGQCVWGDTPLQDLLTAWRTGARINCELVLNAAGDKYAGSFSVTNAQISGPYNDMTSYSFTLSPTGALTFTEGA